MYQNNEKKKHNLKMMRSIMESHICFIDKQQPFQMKIYLIDCKTAYRLGSVIKVYSWYI